jgi:hypothetical protein
MQDLHVCRHAGVGFSGAHGWRKVSSHNYVTIGGVFTRLIVTGRGREEGVEKRSEGSGGRGQGRQSALQDQGLRAKG